MRLSSDWVHPAEGELIVAALADQTYAVLRRLEGVLFEVQSGEEVAPVEIVAAEHLEEWPFGQGELFEVGDSVSVEMPGTPIKPGGTYDMGRVLHTHGGEAWVRLIGGESLVVSLTRLRLLPE